jgi:pantoate--beta-alanine ligase
VKIVEHPQEAYAHVDHWRRTGLRIGLIPTMGALHEGHLALVRRSRAECDVTVVTIFVNPTQFGPHEDFGKYPRTFEADCALLRDLQTDLVFAPTPELLYPSGYSCYVDPPAVALPLEGKCRPGHFRGVATIVLKLFQILPATISYFGQKDYQQLAVIRHMVEDLNVPIRVEGCETIREPDGLAMSSRNRYLTADQRRSALSLWKALSRVRELVDEGLRSIEPLEQAMERTLYDEGADHVEYARVVDAHSLATLTELNVPAVALIAARVGTTRLIDNYLISKTS